MSRSLRTILYLVPVLALCGSVVTIAAEGKVNINTAAVEELALLPRVGSVVAERIVEFRDQNGRFKRPDELLLVSGIGDRTFDLIEPYVSVEGETTLKEKVSSSGDR